MKKDLTGEVKLHFATSNWNKSQEACGRDVCVYKEGEVNWES